MNYTYSHFAIFLSSTWDACKGFVSFRGLHFDWYTSDKNFVVSLNSSMTFVNLKN